MARVVYRKTYCVAIALMVTYIFPLFFVMLMGPKALREYGMSPVCFLICCFLPFLFIVICPILYCRRKRRTTQLSDTATAIVDKLDGPFRFTQFISWEGVIVLRRLLIAIALTFIQDILLRHFILTSLCLVIFLIQVIVNPFKARSSNMFENMSLLMLCILSVISLIKAVIYNLSVLPYGSLKKTLTGIEYTEFALSIVLPFSIVIVVSLLFLIRCLILITECCYCKCLKRKSSSPRQSKQYSASTVSSASAITDTKL